MNDQEDFNFFRGLKNGLIISAILWIGIISLVSRLFNGS